MKRFIMPWRQIPTIIGGTQAFVPRPALKRGMRNMQLLLTALFGVTVLAPSGWASCASLASQRPHMLPMTAVGGSIAEPDAGASLAEDSSSRSEHRVSIVGLWDAKFLAGSQVFDFGFDLWHADGTELFNDVTNPIEGNVCVGVWEKSGPRTYKLKHVTWNFDAAGNLTGSGVFHETVTLSANGDRYRGTITSTFYDLSGNVLGQYEGTIEAKRIKPDDSNDY